MSRRETPLTIAGLSDVGRVREENEDGFFSRVMGSRHRGPFDIRAVLVVADGIGGHAGGRAASATVVTLLSSLFARRHLNVQAEYGDDIESFITGIIREADARVHLLGEGHAKAPGTTFTGAFVVDSRAYVGHVGDSRAYQIRNDEIIALTDDHSYAAHLVRQGKLTPEEAEGFPQKNVLLRSLGTEGGVTVDEPVQVHLLDGDVLLLCTDGLWDLVSKREIVSIVQEQRHLDKACARLVALANSRGGHDNITVVAVRFGRFRKGRALPPSAYGLSGARVPGRVGRAIVRISAATGLVVLCTLLVLIALFILNELAVLSAPLPAELLKRLVSR